VSETEPQRYFNKCGQKKELKASERDRTAALLHLVRPKKELNGGEPVEKAQKGEKCRWLHVWNGNLILLDRMQLE
jgi:hypothetical protein